MSNHHSLPGYQQDLNMTSSNKKKYQILWFPLEEPLSEEARRRRKVVTSDKFC